MTEYENIYEALFAASAHFEAVRKDSDNPHFGHKFASLKSVLNAVSGALREHGLLLIQTTEATEGGRQVLHTELRLMNPGTNKSGSQTLNSSWELHPVKADPQGEGSALTYARRYAILTMFGLVPEDDDGNDASTANSRERQQQEDQAKAEAEERARRKEVETWMDQVRKAENEQEVRAIGNDANRARMLDVKVGVKDGVEVTLKDMIDDKISGFSKAGS